MSCRQVSERFGEAFCLDDLGAQRESLPSRIARRGVAKIWFKWLLWVQAVRKLRRPSQLGALAERTLLGSGWRTPSLASDPPGHPARGQGPRKKLPRQKAVIARSRRRQSNLDRGWAPSPLDCFAPLAMTNFAGSPVSCPAGRRRRWRSNRRLS
jgi:hypothetical protein